MLLIALALLAACAAPAAARDLAVAVPGQPGNDRTCDPCRTIAGALAKARSLPSADRIALGRGVYREDMTIDDPGIVSIWGLGAATVVAGRIGVSVPPGERLPDGSVRVYEYDPGRSAAFVDLALRPADGVVRARATNLILLDVDVAGRIHAQGAAVTLDGVSVTTPAAPPCEPAILVHGAPTRSLGGFPERYPAGAIARSVVRGATAVTVVDADLRVNRSILLADGPACSRDGVRVIDGGLTVEQSLIARSTDGALGAPAVNVGAGVYGDNATVQASLTTIGGPFDAGVSMTRCFLARSGCGGVYDLRGLAVAGARLTAVFGSDDIRRNALAWVVGTGPLRECSAQNRCRDTAGVDRDAGGRPRGNVFGELLEDPTLGPAWGWFPRAASPLVDAVTDNAGARAVGGTPDLVGGARPVPISPGGAALYDVGAYEHPTVLTSPERVPGLGGAGPAWAGVDLGPGGLVGGRRPPRPAAGPPRRRSSRARRGSRSCCRAAPARATSSGCGSSCRGRAGCRCGSTAPRAA